MVLTRRIRRLVRRVPEPVAMGLLGGGAGVVGLRVGLGLLRQTPVSPTARAVVLGSTFAAAGITFALRKRKR